MIAQIEACYEAFKTNDDLSHIVVNIDFIVMIYFLDFFNHAHRME